MGSYLYVIKYEDGPGLRISDELDSFMTEHCRNYNDSGVSDVNFADLAKDLKLDSKQDLLTCDKIPEDFRELIKDRIDGEDIIFTVDQ